MVTFYLNNYSIQYFLTYLTLVLLILNMLKIKALSSHGEQLFVLFVEATMCLC